MSTKPPLVTIIITSYNKDAYINSAIKSVLEQTYQFIELIIADDNSDYFIVEEVKSFINKNNSGNILNSVVYRNDENMGTCKNLNEAI